MGEKVQAEKIERSEVIKAIEYARDFLRDTQTVLEKAENDQDAEHAGEYVLAALDTVRFINRYFEQ